MGKRGKNQWRQHKAGSHDEVEDVLPSSAYERERGEDEIEEEEEEAAEEEEEEGDVGDRIEDLLNSKFNLYQRSVQSPRGDVSYMQKFFLMYIGGRMPLHLQEDFCGTALLSTEWLRSDPRRTAIGLDLDLEALEWCLENNMNRIGADGFSRISLFHGNVLNPEEACLVQPSLHEIMGQVTLSDDRNTEPVPKISSFPPRDIVCAFNYSCCCLLTRVDLLGYFKHVLRGLSRKGGIFVMDLYGGTSSECSLKLQRKFPGFTYIWEQQEFDIVNRLTRISLHFQLGKKKTLRHAFSYKWRLWSLPEVRDCMMEAGFSSVHVWMRDMPDSKRGAPSEDSFHSTYEETTSFQQRDSWNAYVVATAPSPKLTPACAARPARPV
ncbi:S-adenosyl-L-methionine-dependent methyltransferases superfamily protein [Wolffia australiana]